MTEKKKKLSPLWLIPAVVIMALILWCMYFPLTMFAGLSKDVEPLSATVIVDKVPETPAITFTTNETEQMTEVMEALRGVRGRFMGWFSMITHNDDALPHLIVTGNTGDALYSLSLCADSDGYVYIQEGNVRLRAKDTALYDYLAAMAAKGEREPVRAMEEDTVKTVASDYVEKLSRVIYLYEDIDLREGTVLAYGYSPEMQYVVEKSYALKEERAGEFPRNNYKATYTVEDLKIKNDTATVTLYEGINFRYEDVDFDSVMGNEYTVTLKKFNGEWLVFSVEGGDTYSLKEMGVIDYKKAMPELYAQAGTEEFSFRDTLTVQITNVIKTEKRILPAEDNFEYEVYTVLPSAEIEVLHAAMVETSDQRLVGEYVLYDDTSDPIFIEPGMPNIPITETTSSIGAESVGILAFELYTGEK